LAPRKAAVRLGHHPWSAGHALDAARDHHVGTPRLDLPRRRDRRLHAGAAQAVHRLAGHLDGETCEQQRHARDVAVVLAGLVRAAEDDVGDICGVKAGALAYSLEDDGGEIVGPHFL